MAGELITAYPAQDNYTGVITAMSSAGKALSKDVRELQAQLMRLSDTRVDWSMDTTPLRQQLEGTQQQFLLMGDAADGLSLRMSSARYDGVAQRLQVVRRGALEARREVLDLTDAISRSENRADGLGASAGKAFKSILAGKGGEDLQNALDGAARTYLVSAYGDTKGEAISGVLSGAVSGAIKGSAAGGLGIGTAVGAAVGAASAGITAATQAFEKREQIMKATRGSLVENALDQQAATLALGVPISVSREANIRGLEHFLNGNDQTGKEFHQSLIELSRSAGIDYDTAVIVSKDLLGSGMSGENAHQRLQVLASATAGLGLSDSSAAHIYTALENVRTAGAVDEGTLRSLSGLGMDARDALTPLLSDTGEPLDAQQLAEHLPDLDPDVFVEAVYHYLETQFEGAAMKAGDTFDGLRSAVASYEHDKAAAMGEGYEQKRSEGLRSELAWQDSEMARSIREAYSAIGEYEANLENEKAQAKIDELNQLVESDDYRDALERGDGAQLKRMLGMADVDAEIKFGSSADATGVTDMMSQMLLDATESMIANPELVEAQKRLGEAQAKGYMAGYNSIFNRIYEERGFVALTGSAWGLPYVPYDDYPARLHQGERVLTAQEARSYSQRAPSVTVTGNQFHVREESDINRIAQALFTELQRAQQVS